MMLKKYFGYTFIAIALVSCASDKINLSPLSQNLGGMGNISTEDIATNYRITTKEINYSSEITNLIAGIPKFSSQSINIQIYQLKSSLQNYLYAFEANNKAGQQRYIKDFEKSYKKIQSLKSQLSGDEEEVINRYLVRIKTNLSLLNSSSAAKNN